MAKLSDLYSPLVPSPASSRVLGAFDAFSLWFSLGIGLLVLQAGSFLVPGLGLGAALAAIVVGTGVGVILLGLAGVVGADTRVSSMATLRPTLGATGAAVPALLNTVQLAGWGAFEIIAMRDAADAFMLQTFGVSSLVGLTLLFGLAATGLAFMGPLSFVRRFLRRWGIWFLASGALWLTWRLFAENDVAALFARPAEGGLSFAGGIDLVIAMPLSWLPLIADYTRFGRTPGKMFRGSALGYFVANVWFYSLGACYALLAIDGQGPILAALAMAGGGLAIVLILIDETDNAFADIFSAAMSTATLVKTSVRNLSLAFGALCTLIALVVPLAKYENFLLLIGSVFAPLFGVLLTDHFIVRRRKVDLAAITEGPRWRWLGFAAWIAGVVTYHLTANNAPQFGATLPAFVLAGGLYLLLQTATRKLA